MSLLRTALLAAGLVLTSAPALAHQASRPVAQRVVVVPTQLEGSERERYQAVFADLRAQNWTGAAARLDGMREGPLHNLARAMLYTAPGSPRVELGPLADLLGRAPELPQASDLHRLARSRGGSELAEPPSQQRLGWLGGQPRRERPRTIRGDPAADTLEPLIQPLLVADQPFEAEALFNEHRDRLSEEAKTAFRQRIAWVFFLNGNDRDARRVAEEGARGSTEWATHSNWVAALACWRSHDYAAAATHFRAVASRSSDIELTAAAHYWTARADIAGGQPQRAQGHLQQAARLGETFYGLLAQSALGIHRPAAVLDQFSAEDWHRISDLRNVRTAIALTEIGENELAGEMLRHQARIGVPAQHEALLHLAARLNLTSAQMWLAHNGPRGMRADTHDRYPSPSWRPTRGWRVDQALVFAHALQESNFRPEAVSPAGARGLMQVLPGTAQQMARARGETANIGELNRPSVNMEYGQSYLEYLRDQPSIGGLLPRVIAAYNAGPRPIGEWSVRFDQSDPLLFIESIPYWETRGYVPIVLRNYWIYEERNADESPSRRALAAGLWPRFPGMAGASAVRIEPRRPQTAMGAD
jgi:soluble lytic murein transglycosylase-like protein